MTSIISSPTYDPAKTAVALAEKQTEMLQKSLTAQTKNASTVDAALTRLRNTISSFQTSLGALTGLNKSIFAQSATLSDSTLGSATASPKAQAGTYSFFVEQLATASQMSYRGLMETNGTTGELVVKVGSAEFTVDLAAAARPDGWLLPQDIAAAINSNPDNKSLVTASVIRTGTVYELVLTANATGKSSAISIDTSGLTNSSLKSSNGYELTEGQNAIIRLNSEDGTKIEQSSNTFSIIEGVSMTFTRAQASGSSPVSVTVATDNKATGDNMQAFVDAYNKLKTALDAMLDPGDPSKNIAPSVFAQDAGLLALRDRLVTLLRPAGSASLAGYGVVAQRDGTLSLDKGRLNKQLAADPYGLDKLMGSAELSKPTGIAGALDKFLNVWSNSTNGQLVKRQESNTKLQKTLADRQLRLDNQYNAAYQRYLMQFTQLQVLQNQMTSNSTMFDALFGKDSK
ncbi:flagellar filament capping protein FliD [Massilia horti]|uniref:Flagellar hook-associated protein 2 n=1 Tax=Massilia horti TaxID=2562153 RepID=A0A4Y9SX60_9BURK|nr:flagellar filament capping protein FliD [Massilia horti]TFW31416.1 hypothetical protein E4O92_13900 [Massilia horti]